MRRSFSYGLLITCILLFSACKSPYVLSDFDSRNITISEDINPVDSQLIRIYLPYKNILEKDMSRVISYSEMEMKKAKPESNLTNFLADMLLYEGVNEAENLGLDFKPQISIYNYWGIRTSIPIGNVTVGKIFELMPFENELVFVQFSGNKLQEFLNSIAANGGDGIGGVQFVISNQMAKDVKVNGGKLVRESNYWIVTNDYIADGNDGMDVFLDKKDLIKTDKKIRDIIISNLEKKQSRGEKLHAELDGRIVNE